MAVIPILKTKFRRLLSGVGVCLLLAQTGPVVMMRVPAAVLLLGLLASCRSRLTPGRPPPTVNISLDEDPQMRWDPLLKVFDLDYLRKATAEVIDARVPKWVHHALAPLVVSLEKYIPQPYAGEILGLASHFGDVSDVIILNFAYEISAFCTSIVAQDQNGYVFHGRNLDFPHTVLRNLTVDVNFLKKGQVAYSGTSFAGYVGLWTGQSPNKFTVSGNQRGSQHWWNWWKNLMSGFILRRSPVSWLVRETLEEAKDFKDAVMRLAKIPLITAVYYVVGGVRAKEGVVITRERQGPADIWPLDPLNGSWYIVQMNFDHWLTPPAWDLRKDAIDKALNATGQDHINMETLFQVLSVFPVCHGHTVYTTVMSAAAPEKYNTVIRTRGCSPN